MPTLAITHAEMHDIINALPGGGGVSKSRLREAAQLRINLMRQMAMPTSPPKASEIGRIASRWPTGDVSPVKRNNWAFKSLEQDKQRSRNRSEVPLHKATRPEKLTVDDVLKGLI